MVTYLHKLVAEGLLDPESFTQTDDQARQKLANGKSFVVTGNAQTLVNNHRPDLAKTLPNAKMAKIPLPIGPAGEVNPFSRLENGIMISTKARESKNFVAMMQFIDWLWYSDAGLEFARWGIEGTTFTKDASGKRTLNPGVDFLGLNPKAPKHLQKDFGFQNGVFAYGGSPDLVRGFFSPEELEFQKVMDARPPRVVPPPAPLTDEEREQVSLWETPLKDFVTQNTLQVRSGPAAPHRVGRVRGRAEGQELRAVHRRGQQGVRTVPEEQRLISGRSGRAAHPRPDRTPGRTTRVTHRALPVVGTDRKEQA